LLNQKTQNLENNLPVQFL